MNIARIIKLIIKFVILGVIVYKIIGYKKKNKILQNQLNNDLIITNNYGVEKDIFFTKNTTAIYFIPAFYQK